MLNVPSLLLIAIGISNDKIHSLLFRMEWQRHVYFLK